MGHYLDYMSFPKNTKESEMYKARMDCIEDNGERENGHLLSHDSGFKLHNIVCDSYDEAVEKINSLDNGWYDDHGVMYKSYKGQSKAMVSNRDKVKEVRIKKNEYIEANDIHNRTSETITCPKCKSRLNLSYVRGNNCPLCRTDLRSNTVLKRIEAFDSKIKELDKKYAEFEKKQKYEVMWLVKLEFHV